MRHTPSLPAAGLLLALACLLPALSLSCASDDKNAPTMTRKIIDSGLDGAAGDNNPAVVSRTPLEVESLKRETAPPAEYVVGPLDVLGISVQSDPLMGGETAKFGSPVDSSRVDGAGFIQLPVVRQMKVSGLTLRQIQEKLEAAYKTKVNNPQVVVELMTPRSQSLYLVGQMSTTGVYFLERPTDVLQALALGHGVTATGNLRSARVLREGKIIPVDLYRLLEQGDFTQNIWLKPGDTIYVPEKVEPVVFMLGDVGKPGTVAMSNGHLTLLEAFSQAGGLIRIGSNLKQVHIIRSHSATRGELIVVNVERLLKGETLPLSLMPGDVVFVPRSGIGNWNDFLTEINPSLQAFSGAVQPFIFLRLLSK